MNAAVSIHDVAPETLDRVKRIVSLIRESADGIITLLVIPGRDWQPDQLAWLRQAHDDKCRLAGHGWHHRAIPSEQRNLYHRLHSYFLSREVAEHLSRPEPQLMDLMRQCHQWFYDNDLPHPVIYVPPAWAMGNVSRKALRQLPFRYFETVRGIYDAQTNVFHKSFAIGYEADVPCRKLALTINNGLALRCTRKPVRLGIHPYDLEFLLADQLRDHLRQVPISLSYPELCQHS